MVPATPVPPGCHRQNQAASGCLSSLLLLKQISTAPSLQVATSFSEVLGLRRQESCCRADPAVARGENPVPAFLEAPPSPSC